MARRIDIELTSARPDGSWTWRAAGALKPRGMLEGSLLYEGAKPGDVVRADAEFEIEGITIVGVLPPREKKRSEPERLEVVGPPRENTPGVTASLTSRPDRRDRPDGATRAPRRSSEGGPGRRGPDRTGRSGSERGGSERGGAERSGAEHSGSDRGGSDRGGRSQPPVGDSVARDRPVRAGRDQPGRDSAARGRPSRERPAERSGADRAVKPSEAEAPARAKARRLNPGSVSRTAVLESLPPEQRPIAEQVLRGGIPAVRTAIHLEREKASVEGRSAPNAEALLAIAEELLPRLKAAEWRDRAEAAAKIADELALRDLRSVVAGADVARDEESRQLAVQLRDALERRVNSQRQEWLDDVIANLDDGRVVRALRVSARPPDPGSRFPAELATRLADVAGEAMGPETPPERWAALLEAVAASPVRRSVKPAGLPPEPGDALLHAARQSSGRVPALAPMLGISMPPPPGPARPLPRPPRPAGRPGGPGRPACGRPAGQRATAAPPPPPPRPEDAAQTALPTPTAADPAAPSPADTVSSAEASPATASPAEAASLATAPPPDATSPGEPSPAETPSLVTESTAAVSLVEPAPAETLSTVAPSPADDLDAVPPTAEGIAEPVTAALIEPAADAAELAVTPEAHEDIAAATEPAAVAAEEPPEHDALPEPGAPTLDPAPAADTEGADPVQGATPAHFSALVNEPSDHRP